MTRANNDLHNLLRATKIATLFLDNRLRIKGFTPAATELINLIESDIGRPLRHIVTNLHYDTLLEDAGRVLDSLDVHEREIQTKDGRWFNMRILPYRTVGGISQKRP